MRAVVNPPNWNCGSKWPRIRLFLLITAFSWYCGWPVTSLSMGRVSEGGAGTKVQPYLGLLGRL